jgi:hypothetical protein
MTRNEEIMEAAFQVYGKNIENFHDTIKRSEDFIHGAQWADEHPNKESDLCFSEMWVARDMNDNLFLYKEMPEKWSDGLFDSVDGYYVSLPKSMFQDVTFKDSPKKIKIIVE